MSSFTLCIYPFSERKGAVRWYCAFALFLDSGCENPYNILIIPCEGG